MMSTNSRGVLLHALLLLIVLGIHTAECFSNTGNGNGNSNRNIQYRPGETKDEMKIASTLLKELMNPLGIQSDRFIVATSDESDSDSIGWAQTKPLGAPTQQQRDPTQFNARPGSYSLDQEIDDDMWDDFESNDSIQVPVGWASLPWTKEYRDMQTAVSDRNERRQAMREQRELELLQTGNPQQLWELSSVYVEKAYRGQGIGTELVRRVLKQRLQIIMSKNRNRNNSNQKLLLPSLPSNIYLLTLATTAPWYEDNFGFEIVETEDVPAPMALEVAAGSIITKLIGAELCCMRGTAKTVQLCGLDFP